MKTFATDLDRTLLPLGTRPSAAGRRAVRTAREIGLNVLLVSGRRLEDLHGYARAFGGFDGIVAENGAVVEAPCGTRPVVVGGPVGAAVRRSIVGPLASEAEFGKVVASFPKRWVRPVARRVAPLPVRLVANVDRVMVLPEGVTKGTGVTRALGRMHLSRWGYAAIGDGENDVDLLKGAVLSGAVANATPSVRRVADYLCRGGSDDGVLEFVEGPLTRMVQEAR